MKRVLIIEDEPTLRASMARGLARLPGVEVLEAGSLAEAVAILDTAPPQLVLSDIDLPDRSGIEILGEVSRRALGAPIVFISAYRRAYGAQIPRHADVEMHEKPVSLEDLRAIVMSRLGASPGSARAPFTARDYLQLACLGRHSVEIEVRGPMERAGRIVVARGEVWSAVDGAGAGDAALRRLLRADAEAECRTLPAAPGARDVLTGWRSILFESADDGEPDTVQRASPGADPRGGRVLLVEPDGDLRLRLAAALEQAGVPVLACADVHAAQACLADQRPALLLCRAQAESPELAAMGSVPELAALPRVVLSLSSAPADLLDGLDPGADDVVTLGMGARAIAAKLRAALRLVGHARPERAGARTVCGVLGAGGALVLVKLCEERRLNARLSVESAGAVCWVDFVGGEISGSGREGEASGEDALDALLAAEQGTYRIELRDPDLDGLAHVAAAPVTLEPLPPDDGPASALVPAGRLSALDVDGVSYQVQTEAENRDVFSVTTIIARDGQVVRKLSSAWQRALGDSNDSQAAREAVEQQHARALSEIRTAAPGAVDDGRAFDAASERALSALLRKDYPEAARAFLEAARLRPDDARVRANLERLRALGHSAALPCQGERPATGG